MYVRGNVKTRSHRKIFLLAMIYRLAQAERQTHLFKDGN